MSNTYKSAGVDIEAAEASVQSVKSLIRTTFSPNVLTDIGLFGGFFQPDFSQYKEPVLVSSVDGVGTKLQVAVLTDIHDTVGSDLVNHCVNDIAVSGALPLFFMDYFAGGKFERRIFEAIIRGFVRACKENNCALIGGETAEMPGMYRGEDYDIAGMIVGIVDKQDIINGAGIEPGDVLIGLSSTGLHTNGYSLARSVLFNSFKIDEYIEDLGCTLAEELLRIHRSYLQTIRKIIQGARPKGFAHITGGGILGNTLRIIPTTLSVKIDWGAWEVPAIFRLIQSIGRVDENEMRRVFNMGVGLTLIAHKESVDKILQLVRTLGESAFVVGEVAEAT